jgi:endogenous inhibitor of DNA gyrase (YacG/DUF329 family)
MLTNTTDSRYVEGMQCPICHKPVAISDPYMPFCSERCKLIDLGNWASEKYVISEPVSIHDTALDDLQSDDPE